jgi:hypothetical protein
VSGLEAGERVASAGAFLLDAETRLNLNASTAYFGATRNPDTSRANGSVAAAVTSAKDEQSEQTKIDAALAELPPEDRQLARIQRICPVTELPLGSMGKPEKLIVRDRVVFICCEGCSAALRDEPDKYLQRISDPDNSE